MYWYEKLQILPEGISRVLYREKRYLLHKRTLLSGRLVKLYAEELGGRDFVSLNCYVAVSALLLKPCEMPEEKVIAFIEGAEVLHIYA